MVGREGVEILLGILDVEGEPGEGDEVRSQFLPFLIASWVAIRKMHQSEQKPPLGLLRGEVVYI